MQERHIKKIQLLPNFLTALGLTCGLYVIFKLCVTPQAELTEPFLTAATGLLLLAGIFDLLDGAVARALGVASDFGNTFDSLADAISFGVAPAVIVLKSAAVSTADPGSFLITTAALTYSVCGVLRLVRFSAQPQEPPHTRPAKKLFTGLPIPASAGALVSLNLFLLSSDMNAYLIISPFAKVVLLSIAMTLLGYFMVSQLKFPSSRQLYFKVSNFRMVFLIVVAAMTFFYGVLHHFAAVFLAVCWGYILVSLLLSVKRRTFDIQ